MFIDVILWFIFGVLVGLFATLKLYKGDSRQLITLLLLGIIGALVGGVFGQMLSSGHANFNVLPVLISITGAIILIGFYKNISPQN